MCISLYINWTVLVIFETMPCCMSKGWILSCNIVVCLSWKAVTTTIQTLSFHFLLHWQEYSHLKSGVQKDSPLDRVQDPKALLQVIIFKPYRGFVGVSRLIVTRGFRGINALCCLIWWNLCSVLESFFVWLSALLCRMECPCYTFH